MIKNMGTLLKRVEHIKGNGMVGWTEDAEERVLLHNPVPDFLLLSGSPDVEVSEQRFREELYFWIRTGIVPNLENDVYVQLGSGELRPDINSIGISYTKWRRRNS